MGRLANIGPLVLHCILYNPVVVHGRQQQLQLHVRCVSSMEDAVSRRSNQGYRIVMEVFLW